MSSTNHYRVTRDSDSVSRGTVYKFSYLLNVAVRITSVVVRDVNQSALSITAVKSVLQTRDSEPSDRVLSSGSM